VANLPRAKSLIEGKFTELLTRNKKKSNQRHASYFRKKKNDPNTSLDRKRGNSGGKPGPSGAGFLGEKVSNELSSRGKEVQGWRSKKEERNHVAKKTHEPMTQVGGRGGMQSEKKKAKSLIHSRKRRHNTRTALEEELFRTGKRKSFAMGGEGEGGGT